ncbi:natural resistance-associated macrophage protein [Thermodesulfobium narugense DSM 14796]|uniref:Natural resistance-associated macrophage protein n=1 Tax=Thermodesulfobium narugense DSM 14796 TaxID=747365 RepID=M1E947_9BACT|nr:natural resistance-associated macrophage protein [Thermodesulfobium narugense DSM 14796]
MSLFRRILLFLTIMGPGIITANVDNDAGGITTYSVTGATTGYKLLWVLIPMTIALIVVQEMAARMGAVTRKGLADLIRENFGVKMTFLILLGILVADFGNTISEFAGIAASMEIFNITKYISVPICALFVWWTVLKGSYKFVERIFLFACLVYLCYIPSAFMANPPWGEVAKNIVIPHIEFSPSFLSVLIGFIGTTITPWMQFYIQSSTVEKGLTEKEYKYLRLDVITGNIMTNVIALFIVVSCAATLFVHNVNISDAKDAALALKPFAGNLASTLFAIGLFNASIFSACILPLATAYYVCEALGFNAGLDFTWKEAPVFYSLTTFLIMVGAIAILMPNAPLVPIMFWSQVINGVILPFVLLYMLKIINNKDIMGEYTNSKTFNIIAWLTTIILIILTLLMVITSIFPNLLPS